VTTGDQVPKLTIPSPNMVHYRGGRAAIDESVYAELEPFWADLTAAYADEVRRLGELGCTYLQLDDTSLAYLNDPEQRAMVAAQGGDPSTCTSSTSRMSTPRSPAARRHAGHHAHVPRQLPLVVGGRGWL
jgi:methionine synthase II (cobalamin-independent)